MTYKPDNVPQLSPYMVVKDVRASIAFYEKAFGFKVDYISEDDKGSPRHVSMTMGDAFIMFGPEGGVDGMTKKSPISQGIQMPISMYVYCKNTDEQYNQAINTGAKSIMEPHDTFWGDRFCSVLDIDNYEWGFATVLKK